MESFASKENFEISREVVLESFLSKGKSEESIALLTSYIDQHQESIRHSFPEGIEQIRAELDFEIELVQLFIDAKLFEEAKESFESVLQAPSFTDEQNEKLRQISFVLE